MNIAMSTKEIALGKDHIYVVEGFYFSSSTSSDCHLVFEVANCFQRRFLYAFERCLSSLRPLITIF